MLNIFIWVLGIVSFVYADFMNEAIKSSYSVRAMGRGGAEVADPYGADSLYSNPAGLAQDGGSYQYNNMDSMKMNADYNRSNVFHRRSFGTGIWRQTQLNDFTEITAIGLARRSSNGVDWGLSYKSIYFSQDGERDTMWSSDLGVIVRMNQNFNLGFLGKDIMYDEELEIDPSFISGFLFKNKSASFKLYSDFVYQENMDDYSDQYVRAGIDYMLTPGFTFRLGGDQLYYTSGVSFDLSFLSVDYALKMPKDSDDESIYGLGFRLGSSKQAQKFRRHYALFKPNSLAYMEINGALTSGYSSISLLGGRKIGSNDLIRLINEANKDKDCQGFLIRIKSLEGGLSNIALIQEIRMELMKSRDLGKKVIVFLDGMSSMPSYYLASMADHIVMPPMGNIYELGIQFEVVKFNGLMDRLGISFDTIRSGKHKVATSPFSDELTQSQKETIMHTLDNVFSSIQNDVRQSRSVDWLTVQPYFDGRFISSQEAQSIGLIDEIGYWSDISEIVKNKMDAKQDVVLASLSDFSKSSLRNNAFFSFNNIAVVEINGMIVQGRNRQDLLFGGVTTGSDEIAAIFDYLSKNRSIKGVILRINSPGGSMIAGDQILHSINEYKRVSKRPVFASMGSIAASGGYYIALGSDRIFANPATITGSIGVYSGALKFYDLEKELGIEATSLSTGKFMDLDSPHQPISGEARYLLTNYQYNMYQYFKKKVQLSRQLNDDEVSAVAQGQFMSAEEALDVGLVDQIGNYSDVISAMEDKIGMTNSNVIVYGRPKQPSGWNLLEFLFD